MNWIVKRLAGVRIRTKLLGVLVIAMLFVGLVFTGMGYMQQQLADEQKSGLNAETQALLELSELNVGFKTQVQEWKNLLLRGRSPSDYWLKIENSQQTLQQEADEVIASLQVIGMGEHADVVVEFKQAHQALFNGYQTGERALAQGMHFTEVDASVRGMDRAPTKMLSDLTFAIDQYRQDSWLLSQEKAKRWVIIGLCLVVASLAFALFVASALIIQTVVRPLERTCDFLGEMAEGDFRGTLSVESQDEMSKLAHYSNQLNQQLTKVLKEVERSAHQLSVASEELNQSSTQNVARTKQQQDQTHQMASAMTQMSSSVDDVATHAHQASEKTVQANKQTDEAEAILARTITDLESLDLILNGAGTAVSRLASESQEIGGILDVIRNIADQTNLLALNAAIEAARAGEQGRGFAVVADEVRSLSLRTQEATAEIQAMIGKLQAGASDAVVAMENGQEGSRRGLEQTREAGDALVKIHNQLNQLNDMNAHLAASALEQSQVSTEISANVQQMRQLSDDVANETQVGQGVAKQLYGNAERLEQQLHRFQLG